MEISRKKSHAPRCRLEHDRRNDEQIDGTDSFHERSGEKRTDDASKLAAHADEREQAFTLVGAEYIRHERPEDGKDEKIESAADPNEESCPDPKLCSVAQVVHRQIKDGEIQNEKTVNDRDELASRHTCHDGREGSVGDKRNEQCASEHPPEILDAVVRADVIAHWFDDIVTAEDEKIKNEPEPECAQFVGFYVNDFGEDAFHINDEARMSNDEGMTKPEELFVIRPFELISSFVIRISSFLSSSRRQELLLRVQA